MIVRDIKFTKRFIKDLSGLSETDRDLVAKKESIFRSNPLHPSLRLHRLKGNLSGVWSISVTNKIRIIFKRKDGGVILFYSVGKHDIYKNL